MNNGDFIYILKCLYFTHINFTNFIFYKFYIAQILYFTKFYFKNFIF